MAKRDNARFKDAGRAVQPKRSGKNRRDYGDASRKVEPRRAGGSGANSRPSQTKTKGAMSARGGRSLQAKAAAGVGGAGNATGARNASSARGTRAAAANGSAGIRQYDNIGMDGLEVLSGRNPVLEALKGDRDVERIFVAQGTEGSISQIVAIAREQGVIVDYVDKERINAMAPGEKHQGVVAKVSAYKYSELEDVFERARVSGEDPFLILLDEVSDPHNLGAIIRTAECAGAHGVIIPKRRACSLTQTVALSAAGAIESMPVVQVTNLSRTIRELKERGLWIAAVDMDGTDYYKSTLDGPMAIVIGSEGHGISRIVKENCDFTLAIPMKGRINSLNASNAAAIIMYAIRRSREERK